MIDSGRKDRHLWKLNLGDTLLGKLGYSHSSGFEKHYSGYLWRAWHVMAALHIGTKSFKFIIIFVKFIPTLRKWLRTFYQNLKQLHVTRLKRGKNQRIRSLIRRSQGYSIRLRTILLSLLVTIVYLASLTDDDSNAKKTLTCEVVCVV